MASAAKALLMELAALAFAEQEREQNRVVSRLVLAVLKAAPQPSQSLSIGIRELYRMAVVISM